MRLPRARERKSRVLLGQPEPPAFWLLIRGRLSRRKWGEPWGARSQGQGWALWRAPDLSPVAQAPRCSGGGLEPGFLPGKPASHCFTHSDDNSPSWSPTPSGGVGGCLLGAERLGKQRLPPRSAEVWRRGSKGGKKAASPSPSLSLQCWAVTCQGL